MVQEGEKEKEEEEKEVCFPLCVLSLLGSGFVWFSRDPLRLRNHLSSEAGGPADCINSR